MKSRPKVNYTQQHDDGKNLQSIIVDIRTPLNSNADKDHDVRSFFTQFYRRFSSIAKPKHLCDSATDDSIKLTDTSQLPLDSAVIPQSVSVVANPHNEDICLFSDSPHYVVRIAGTGNVDEFNRLIRDDVGKLKINNAAGLYAIHNAAARNKVSILQIIDQYKGDVNMPDKNSWTALHHAVRHSSISAIEWLLDNGADSTKKTKENEAPAHFAVIYNQLNALKALLSKRPEDANICGDRDSSPLHYAALHDNLEAAKILTDHNARLCQKTSYGLFPIHIAAANNSNKVFRHLFEIARSLGYDPDKVLNFCDSENHRPLHSSVIGGNMEAIQICLTNGAKIDDQQDDLSTPAHLACAQGSLELLKLMFDCQQELKEKVIRISDVQGMTCLHRAAMFDHVDVIAYLLEMGAEIDARDNQKRTPLLLAALKCSLNSVDYLLMKNASITARDECDRNLLHFVIMQGLNFEIIGPKLFSRQNYHTLFDQRDIDGFYPVHYASRDGQVTVLNTLIKYGSNDEIGKKTSKRQSPLHFAAQYGRYNTCKQLLDTPGFKRIINDQDQMGLTSLHLSCQNGHTRVVQLLLRKGAMFSKSYDGNNPLHEAASNGHVNTMKLILQTHSHLKNIQNRLGMSPLHCAASNGHADSVALLLSANCEFLRNKDGESFFDLAIEKKQRDVCLAIIAHDRWKEALDLSSSKYRTPLLGLIEHIPECVQPVFDRCIVHSHDDRKHKEYHLTYDFHYVNWTDKQEIKGKEYIYPMLPLNMMVTFGRTDQLSHPLCEVLLRHKWLSYGFPLYAIQLGFYLFFVIILSYFSITYKVCNHFDPVSWGIAEKGTICPNPLFTSFKETATLKQVMCVWFIVFFCFFNIISEIVQMIQEGRDYFGDLENYAQWFLYISTLVFIFPFLFNESMHYQWEAGACSVFAAWFTLLFLLGRFDMYGIYVIMFLEIMKTLLHVLVLFSILIIGFALTFCVLRPFSPHLDPSKPQHLLIIIIKSVTMMLGELDYDRQYVDPILNHDDNQHFSIITLIFLALFAVVMPILLMNLLVGLAIGDLMEIQRNARLKRLAMQVQLHTNLEKKFPRKMLQRLVKNEYVMYINKRVQCNMLSRTLRQWIRKPLKSKDFLGNVDELYQDSGLLVSLYKQKRRQKDMQRQLEKLTDLVKLIVQKMDIHTEADVDDAPHTGPINMEKLQQIIIAARRFSRVPQRNRLQQQQQQQSQNFLDSKEQ